MGGRLRLRHQPLPPAPVRGLFLTCSVIRPRRSYIKQEFPDVYAAHVQARSRRKSRLCGSAWLRHDLRMGWREADRIAAAVFSWLCGRRYAAGCISRRASQPFAETGRRDGFLAAGGERGGCLCLGRLVCLTRSEADLALPGGASDGYRAEAFGRRSRPASRCAEREV